MPFHGVPTVGSLFSWSTYPQRRQIYHHILLHAYQHLQSSMSPDHVSRLLHLAKFSVKACARDFDFVQSPQPSIQLPDLHFAPMTYMSLLSCVELPDVAFSILISLQCGLQLPLWILQLLTALPVPVDPYGHGLLNSVEHNFRIPSHDSIVPAVASEFRQLGLVVGTTAIPTARNPQHPNSRGDLLINSPGLCVPQRNSHVNSFTRVVLDVSLVHSVTSGSSSPQFKPTRIRDRELQKLRLYRLSYLPDFAFSPLVADSFGRIGDMTLRIFNRVSVSDFIALRDYGNTAGAARYRRFLFHRLCSSFQSSCFLATAQRITRGEFLDRVRVVGASSTMPPPSNVSFDPMEPASPLLPPPRPAEHLAFELFDGASQLSCSTAFS